MIIIIIIIINNHIINPARIQPASPADGLSRRAGRQKNYELVNML